MSPPILLPGKSKAAIFLNTINILAFHIRIAIPTIGKTPEMREFQRDLEIGAQQLNENVNDGTESSEEISFI